ncbi:DsbA family protein, partial [Acinetobacter sp. A11]
MMIRQLHIDVFFDFICPWCLIGKRQLLIAINRFYQL